MYLKELVTYTDLQDEDGNILPDKHTQYNDWCEQVNDACCVILADIGVNYEEKYDEWLDENEEEILNRLADCDVISSAYDMCYEEESDYEEILHDVYCELAENYFE